MRKIELYLLYVKYNTINYGKVYHRPREIETVSS